MHIGESWAYRLNGQWETLALQFPEGLSWTGFGGVRDVGVWSTPLETATASDPTGGLAEFALSPPIPNPTSTSATLRLTLSTARFVAVDVFDVLGRRVTGERPAALAPGTRTIVVDVAGLPAGTYIVRSAAGESSARRRLTVVR